MSTLILVLSLVIMALLGAVIMLLLKLLQRPEPLTREALPECLTPELLANSERRLLEHMTQRLTSLELKEDEISRAQRTELSTALKMRFEENARQLETHLKAVRDSLTAMGGIHDGMQRLGEGVQRFNTLLANVKMRGAWGEMLLERLLADLFVPGQYEKNVKPNPRSQKVVEFALVLPGQEDGKKLWLPIDSKFPLEDYERLLAATDEAMAAECRKTLLNRVKTFASQVAEYVVPPYTTDFAILFLPTEGLFLEVAGDVTLQADLRRKHIILAGPQTLAALFNALQMGFRTLAVQKQSAKAWDLLIKAKKHIDDYLKDCDAVADKIEAAAKKLAEARTRAGALERSLRSVTIPEEETPHA
ncbi:MAG: DNA recombination protein RmuC [Kiritimatiellae bacterium]|nr:DNA recombination protein RmuC [Kiritimatiellia bacterium]